MIDENDDIVSNSTAGMDETPSAHELLNLRLKARDIYAIFSLIQLAHDHIVADEDFRTLLLSEVVNVQFVHGLLARLADDTEKWNATQKDTPPQSDRPSGESHP